MREVVAMGPMTRLARRALGHHRAEGLQLYLHSTAEYDNYLKLGFPAKANAIIDRMLFKTEAFAFDIVKTTASVLGYLIVGTISHISPSTTHPIISQCCVKVHAPDTRITPVGPTLTHQTS